MANRCNCGVCPICSTTQKPITPKYDIPYDKILIDQRMLNELLLEVRELKSQSNIKHILVNQERLTPDSSGEVRMDFENWVSAETMVLNNGVREMATRYNRSNNAVEARAVSDEIAKMDKKIASLDLFNITLVSEVDGRGRPLVKDPRFNTIYITCQKGREGNHFTEWIYLNVNGGIWEKIGDDIDVNKINKMLDSFEDKIHKVAEYFIKENKELCNTINSQNERLRAMEDKLYATDRVMEMLKRIPKDTTGEGAPSADIRLDEVGGIGTASGIVSWSLKMGLIPVNDEDVEVTTVLDGMVHDLKENPTIIRFETTDFTVTMRYKGDVVMERQFRLVYNQEENVEMSIEDIEAILNNKNNL